MVSGLLRHGCTECGLSFGPPVQPHRPADTAELTRAEVDAVHESWRRMGDLERTSEELAAEADAKLAADAEAIHESWRRADQGRASLDNDIARGLRVVSKPGGIVQSGDDPAAFAPPRPSFGSRFSTRKAWSSASIDRSASLSLLDAARRYLTDDRDGFASGWRGNRELVVSMAGNGDWYVSVLPEGHKAGPTVRITTSGQRLHGIVSAIAAVYQALPESSK